MENKYLPGENCIVDFSFNLKPVKNQIRIRFPSRIHMTPIDCNRFDFGKPGGGAYGFGIDANNYISVSFSSDNNIVVNADQLPVVKHFMEIMKRIFRYTEGMDVEIILDKNMKQHFGFGSTAMISCAVIWAINGLFGWKLSKEECRNILTKNFCEGYQGMYLMKGLDTGLGPYIAFNGGFVILSDDAEVIFTEKMPENYTVVLIDNNSKRPDSDLPESIEMLERSRELDSYYRYYKSYTILMDIIPAIRNKDWKKFGKFNLEFQFAGTHLSMIQGYEDKGIKIYSDINDCIANGAIIAGLSSVGPAIFAIVENSASIVNMCKKKNIYCYEYKFNNLGMQEC
jgi:beta-RFAP synthase